MRFGKRAFDLEDLEKRAPMRFGKRYIDQALEPMKRAPMRFGKRELEEDLMEKRAPMRFGKRLAEETDLDGEAAFRLLVEDEAQLQNLADQADLAAAVGLYKRAPMRFGKRLFSDANEVR